MKFRNVFLSMSALTLFTATDAMAAGCGDEPDYNFEESAHPYATLIGNRVNANAPAPSNENWLEDHCAGKILFKVGDGTPLDPYREVGTWDASPFPPGFFPGIPGPDVTYNYGPGGEYTWFLYQDTADSNNLCWERRVGDVESGAPEEVIAIGVLETATCP